MTRFTLLLRNLRYFRGVNAAVVLGMAVATAVLTGALMVGDSVRGSLADLAIQRLGPVDYALISTRFFDQSLAQRLADQPGAGQANQILPAAIIHGGAVNDSAGSAEKPRTADVQIAAVGAPAAGPSFIEAGGFPVARGKSVLNGELAASIDLTRPEGTVLLPVPTQSDAPREAALARRARNDVLNDLRTDVVKIESQPGFVSLFNPNGGQRVPRNAWVNLQDLQEAIDQPGRVNALLVHATDRQAKPDAAAAALNEQLRNVIRLDDYGLSVRPAGNGEATVLARDTYLAPPVVEAARRAADAVHAPLREVSVNLINAVSNVSSAAEPKVIHYAVGAGITSLDDGPLKDDEIAINQWAADQLGAKAGDTLRIDFYLRQPGGDLTDASKALPPERLTFKVKAVLPMTGLGADPQLPPNYKGLTDATSVADWDPPEGLKIDKTLVTKADEDYWKQYRAAPKLFVSFEAARKLWGGVYGDVTGLRVPAADADRFAQKLLAELKPESMGLVFRPLKAEQLAAASGGTDFSMFFVMFSFFLIVAAALLVAMLFRLNIEQRARQFGLLSAVGFAPGSLRRLALGEGMALALVGGLIGLAGAIGYTWLIVLGLRTWWIGAIGTTAMHLYVRPESLAYGLIGSLFVAFCAILWAVWRIGRTQAARLMAGAWGAAGGKRGEGRVLRWVGVFIAIVGIATVAMAMAKKISTEEGFGGGALLLCGCLCWLAGVLRPRRHAGAGFVGTGALARLGMRNAARHTARGVLAVGLVSFAAFTLITVAAMKQEGTQDPGNPKSETGGYRLLLTANIPLTGDLNTPAGRQLLGMKSPDDALWQGVRFTPLRVWAGQDISCLNLTKPSSPTILGIPPEMIRRGGFIEGSALAAVPKGQTIWDALDGNQGDEIPVIADADTQEYVLQIPLGGTIPITDQLGRPQKLKLVASVAHSIFQGQLLMSDGNFRKLFPAVSGFGMALVDTPPGKEAAVARRLSSELDDFSVSVDTTSARLRAYQNVQNTYLSTFQTLGALGLMLGTLGLAVVLVRTVIERKAELALLASLGFTSAARVRLVLAENAFLLLVGLAAGAVCAVVGILPAVLTSSRTINASGLAMTLLAVLVVGLGASAIAVRLSGVHVTPADLRHE
ncbi:MAG TPA: FtsX-like permease family protein [Tepidisphaeraceae bacterium]|jgi:ABC-type antimicrobial peptide transport system permease subunit|nr:FtsX-like permease family protein [Tepidisphaeraceae bacterium]